MTSPEELAAWEAVLDRVEADAARARAAARGAGAVGAGAAGGDDGAAGAPERWAPWEPWQPTPMPPMPEELRERAASVLAAQRQALAAAIEARAEAGRRLAALRAAQPTLRTTLSPTAHAIYVDAVG